MKTCGICGVVNLEAGSVVKEHILQNMRQTLVHRGPDDKDFYINGEVGFVVRSLSSIDLKGGINISLMKVRTFGLYSMES